VRCIGVYVHSWSAGGWSGCCPGGLPALARVGGRGHDGCIGPVFHSGRGNGCQAGSAGDSSRSQLGTAPAPVPVGPHTNDLSHVAAGLPTQGRRTDPGGASGVASRTGSARPDVVVRGPDRPRPGGFFLDPPNIRWRTAPGRRERRGRWGNPADGSHGHDRPDRAWQARPLPAVASGVGDAIRTSPVWRRNDGTAHESGWDRKSIGLAPGWTR